jgi:hypothetical protein
LKLSIWLLLAVVLVTVAAAHLLAVAAVQVVIVRR